MSGRLVFVANMRLPTEKAHGYAIMKHCEAFAGLGMDVELWHPRRSQLRLEAMGVSAFEYYDVRRIFRVVTLKNVDVLRWEMRFPPDAFSGVLLVHEALWGIFAARRARRQGSSVFVTRDILVARAFARHNVVISGVAPGAILVEGRRFARLQTEDPEALERYFEESLPTRRLGTPEDVGPVVAFLCSEQASFMAGSTVPVDGGGS